MAFRREVLNTYDFIDEWRMEPCLWNDRAEGYRDKSARQSALKRLGEKFNMNEQDVKGKITNLRCYYGKELGKQRDSSEDCEAIYISKWPYFTCLEFLRDHITNRPARRTQHKLESSAQVNSNTNDEEDHEDEANDEDADEHEETNEGASSPNKRSIKNSNSNTELDRRRKKVKTKEGEFLDLANGLLRRQVAADRKDEDADDVFGRHIAHELRNITDPRAKQLAKLQIQNVLYDVQFGTAPVFSSPEEST